MTRRWMAGVMLVAGIALLPACGNSSDSGSASSTSAAAPTSASAPTSAATSAPPTADASSTGGKICAYLAQQQAQVAAAKSPAEAATVLTINLATFVSQNPDLSSAIASQLDALTTASCPETRSALLAKLGSSTLADALG